MKIDLCELFGVKPDQVFRIKGSKFLIEGEYRVHEKALQYSVGDSWIRSARCISEFHGSEVVLYYATEDEETILGSLEEKYRNGYIARDSSSGWIFVYEYTPDKGITHYSNVKGCTSVLPYPHLFQFVQFETGAVRIKDIINE